MRLRIGVAISLVVACGSFGSAPESNDASTPPYAAVPSEAGIDGGCPVKRCIDFEASAQNVPPFGFDGVVAHSTDDKRSVGEVAFSTVPTRVNVRLRVRPSRRLENDSTSGHFVVYFSVQADQDGSPFLPYADAAFASASSCKAEAPANSRCPWTMS